MAKRRRKSSSKDCPEPLNAMIDLAGAAAMGAFAKYKVKRDFAKGEGAASIKGATMYYSVGTLRRGSAGTLALCGLLGVRSAVKDIEKDERARKLRAPVYDDGIDLSFYRVHDNRYAWRLNCEDGSGCGIDPENYETRDEYHDALRKAKADFGKVGETGEHEQSGIGAFKTKAAKNHRNPLSSVLLRVHP